MNSLSVVIIALNEVDRIGEAIRSVSFADEILVLDSGSTDCTPELAEKAGARVLRVDWPGHVAQKNRALAEASCDWILSIDADERLSPELARSVRLLLEREPSHDGFVVKRRNHYLGEALRGGRWYPDARVRLVRRGRGRWVGVDPHDRLEVQGRVSALEGDLLHHPYRDLGEHLQVIDSYTRRFVEIALSTGHPRAGWLDVLFRPAWAFVKAWILDLGLLDGLRGLILAGLGATYTLLKWSRLMLAQQGSVGNHREVEKKPLNSEPSA